MFLNPRALAVLLSFLLSLITVLIIEWWLPEVAFKTSLWIGFWVFLASALAAWPVLYYFVFREMDNITNLVERIKKKDYQFARQKSDRQYLYTSNPMVLLKKEITDFARQKQAEINELMKLETFRREFLADVSHELKTPIFAAQGFVHTLLDGAMDDTAVRDIFLQKAANSLDSLTVLVDDLLTISQLESGVIKMRLSHFDLRRLIDDIYEQFDELADRKGTKLKISKFSPRSCYVYADKTRIRQVLTNLIVNAIKYGRDKGTVTVSFLPEDTQVRVTIRDNGPGIEEKHLTRIFERFYRIDKSRSKEEGGTGLGLAIVKHILEAHETRIQVSSQVNEGAEFTFNLKRGKVFHEEN